MNIDMIQVFLGWCIVINTGFLLFWLIMISLLKEFVFKMHGHFFKLSEEQFAYIHYSGMLNFKLGIFLLNVVPYVSLWIIYS